MKERNNPHVGGLPFKQGLKLLGNLSFQFSQRRIARLHVQTVIRDVNARRTLYVIGPKTSPFEVSVQRYTMMC
jgi:hypothetical protein